MRAPPQPSSTPTVLKSASASISAVWTSRSKSCMVRRFDRPGAAALRLRGSFGTRGAPPASAVSAGPAMVNVRGVKTMPSWLSWPSWLHIEQRPLLARIVVALGVFLLVPALARRFRLPGLVGLILAGIALGPSGLGLWSQDRLVLDVLAEAIHREPIVGASLAGISVNRAVHGSEAKAHFETLGTPCSSRRSPSSSGWSWTCGPRPRRRSSSTREVGIQNRVPPRAPPFRLISRVAAWVSTPAIPFDATQPLTENWSL